MRRDFTHLHSRFPFSLFQQYFPCFCAALLLFILNIAPAMADGPSPEFFQLMNELKEDIHDQGINAEGPICVGQGLVLTREVIDDGLRDFLLDVVVVQPLEDGAKTALSLLPQSALAKGAATVAVSTYDLIRCAMDTSGPDSYAGCVGKVVGAVVEGEATGRVKEKLGLEDPATSQAFDRSYKAAKDAIGSYKSRSEIWTYNQDEDDCKSDIIVRWNKQSSGRPRGGTINLIVNHQCDCPNEYDLEKGTYQIFNIPVYYTTASGNKPGWRLGPIPRTRARVKCCGTAEGPFIALSPTGRKVPDTAVGRDTDTSEGSDSDRPRTGGGTSTGTDDDSATTGPPPPPPPPPPVVLPAPEIKEYDRGNPCPPCQPIKDQINAVSDEIGELRDQRDNKLREQNEKKDEQRRLERQIERLQSRLRGEAGIGGESYDPATGRTTSSYDMGDGRVRIRVTDAEGNVISERFRERESTKDIQEELAARQQELAGVNADIERLGREREQLQARIDEAAQRWSNLQKALTDCVEKLCREYATCKQLVEHIRNYESAGLQQRSRDIINELYRRAREKGCFDIDETMADRVKFGYDLTGENIYKPSIMDDLQSPDDASAAGLLQQQQLGPKTAIQQQQQEEEQSPTQDTDKDFDSVADDLQPLGTTPRRPAVTTGEDTDYAPAPVGNSSLDDWSRWRGGRPPNQDEIERAFERYEALTIARISLLEDMEAAKKRCDKAAWERLRDKYYEIGSSRDDRETMTPITGMEPDYSSSGKYRGKHRVGPTHPELKRRGKELSERFKDKITVFQWSEEDCAKKTKISVKVIDVKNISGNNPLDREDPIAEDADHEHTEPSTSTGGSSGTSGGATVQVVNNVPISRLTLAGPDACPEDHYHGNADNCNGVFTPDPAPGVCGHGTVSQVTTIPVSSCPDL